MQLSQMYNFWLHCGKQTLNGSIHFFTAIAITWLVAGVAGGEVKTAPHMAQSGLLIFCLPFYTAAAARARGLIDTSSTGRGLRESTFWLGISRPGIEIEPLIIGLLMALITGIGFVVGALIADETGAVVGVAFAALICLIIMARSWPVFSVPFFFKSKYRWSPGASSWMWTGPGLSMALRLSRRPMARKLATPTFMIPMLVLLLPLLVCRLYWGPHFLLSLLLYAVFLPYLGMLNLNLTGQLLAEQQRQSERPS